MAKPRKQNIFNTTMACIRFIMFWLIVLLHMPIIFLIPKSTFSARYFGFLTWTLLLVTGVRLRVFGKISKERPLMIVSNHISIMEFVTFPIAFHSSFFGKKEIGDMPIIGWIAKKMGVIFVDRRPSNAAAALENVKKEMASSKHPMVLFPEGTTTNGAYVKKFKSTLFNFIEGSNVKIQPVVMNYRYRDGSVIDDETMAEHFAYFNNHDQDFGPKCSRERSAFSQVFHVMVLGGILVEINVLPIPDLSGMDRKKIAELLHKTISDKYIELKDKKHEDSYHSN